MRQNKSGEKWEHGRKQKKKVCSRSLVIRQVAMVIDGNREHVRSSSRVTTLHLCISRTASIFLDDVKIGSTAHGLCMSLETSLAKFDRPRKLNS